MRTVETVTPPGDNSELREAVYAGAIYRLPPNSVSRRLVGDTVDLLRRELRWAGDLRTAQFELPAQELLERLATVRRTLTEARHTAIARSLISAAGFDVEQNAVDLVRLRAVTHGGHRNPAATPAYTAHRDTWYANPQCQINWWIPLYDIASSQSFAFYPAYFDRPVANSSGDFDYDTWVANVGWQSYRRRGDFKPIYPTVSKPLDPAEGLTFSMKAAEILIFSAAHLHQTVFNDTGETRLSVDFRTVHLGDHECGRGAPNVDNRSRGSALVDYVQPAG